MSNQIETMNLISKRLAQLESEYEAGKLDVMSYAHKTDELRYVRDLLCQ